MTLRCKPGDLAINVYPGANLGKLFLVGEMSLVEGHWNVECLSGLARTQSGDYLRKGLCEDSRLRPLKGDITEGNEHEREELTA